MNVSLAEGYARENQIKPRQLQLMALSQLLLQFTYYHNDLKIGGKCKLFQHSIRFLRISVIWQFFVSVEKVYALKLKLGTKVPPFNTNFSAKFQHLAFIV